MPRHSAYPFAGNKAYILRFVLCGEHTMCMPEHRSKLNETCSRACAAPINILHGSCCCPHVYPSRLWLEPNVYRGLSALCRRSIEVISITVTCIALLNLETETLPFRVQCKWTICMKIDLFLPSKRHQWPRKRLWEICVRCRGGHRAFAFLLRHTSTYQQ